MIEDDRNSRFSEVVLPHLPDALTTALWLTGNRTDAEDVVQETIAADLANYDFGAGHDPADFIQIGGIATNNDPFFATVNNNVLAAGGRLSQFDLTLTAFCSNPRQNTRRQNFQALNDPWVGAISYDASEVGSLKFTEVCRELTRNRRSFRSKAP